MRTVATAACRPDTADNSTAIATAATRAADDMLRNYRDQRQRERTSGSGLSADHVYDDDWDDPIRPARVSTQ